MQNVFRYDFLHSHVLHFHSLDDVGVQ